MTIRFSENGDLNEAKQNLSKIDFVGLIEEFDTSMLFHLYYFYYDFMFINLTL